MQELTRHAANLAMLAAAAANPVKSKHYYLGFQAEHKLAATGALALSPKAHQPLTCMFQPPLHGGSTATAMHAWQPTGAASTHDRRILYICLVHMLHCED